MITRFMVAKSMRDNADNIEDMLITIFLLPFVIYYTIKEKIGRQEGVKMKILDYYDRNKLNRCVTEEQKAEFWLMIAKREAERIKREEEQRALKKEEQKAKARWQRYVQNLPENNIRQIESNAIYEAYAEYCESTRWQEGKPSAA